MSSFKFVHMRHLAELEKNLRDAEIELEEHEETYNLPDRIPFLEVLKAKVRLALFRARDYALRNQLTSPRLNCSRIPPE